MRSYDVALFVHIGGALVLFGGITVLQAAGVRLRRASTVAEAALWLDFARGSARLPPLGGGLLLASGLVMTATAWTFTTPWVLVGLATLLAVGVVSGGVQGQRFDTIAAAVDEAEGPVVPPDIAATLTARSTWVPVFAGDGAAVGVVWLMATKPGWAWSLVAVLACTVAGAVAGVLATPARRVALSAG